MRPSLCSILGRCCSVLGFGSGLLAIAILFFSSSVAQAAEIKAVQRGSVTFTSGANRMAVTLSPAVDPTKTIVWGGIPHGGGRLGSSNANATRIAFDLESSTTLALERLGSPANSPVVEWQAVEFSSGVSVQRGLRSLTTSQTTVNVTLPTAVDLTKSFVLVSVAPNTSSATVDERWTVRSRLTTSTNLELSRTESSTALDVYWQVIQMEGASVQRGLRTLASGASSGTSAITSVNTANSFLIMSYRGAAAVNGIESQYMARGTITNSTTLTFNRVSTTNSVDIAWEVVSMSDGTTVQRGARATSATSNTTLDQAITSVDLSRAFVYISAQGGSGTATANLDESAWTGALTSATNLRLQRGGSGTNGTVNWQVIQFAAAPAATPTRLAITSVNSGANPTAGSGFSVVVEAQDSTGSPANVTADTAISLSLKTGTGTLGGTLTGTIAAGTSEVTIAGVTYTKAESGVVLTATRTSGDTLTAGDSAAFTVNPGAATTLVFTTQPTDVAAGTVIPGPPTVTVRDSLGNTVTSSTASITVAIGNNPGGATLSGTLTKNAVSGIALFGDLSLNNTGTGYTLTASSTGLSSATSNAFNVVSGAATKLLITSVNSGANPTAGTGFPVVVQAQDAGGNPTNVASATGVSVSLKTGTGTLGGTLTGTIAAGTSQVTITGVTYTKAESGVVLTATRTSGDTLTAGDSSAFTVNPGAATTLVFTTQPGNALSGNIIPGPPTVTVRDSFGNTVTSHLASVAVAIGTNPTGGVLSGNLTKTLVSGVASFSDLNINQGGSGYTLTASSTGLTAATSNAFNITSVPSSPAVIKVGSFTKSTFSAPASQSVAHGLGETPKALILWTSGGTIDADFRTGFRFALGVSDGTTSRSASAASNDALAASNASRRQANKALTIVGPGEIVLAEADLSSWDATAFTLNWTTNDTNAYIIHFIAIGGSDVLAKVVGWTTATAVGNKAVTGVGFQPDLVLHAHSGGLAGTPPVSGVHGIFGLGAMNNSGEQWANTPYARDNSATSDTQRAQQTNASILSITNGLGTFFRANFASMDADGFTVNFTKTQSTAYPIFSLALKGMQTKLGSFGKATAAAPAGQPVTGVGFQPGAILLSSFQDIAQTSAVAQGRFGLGASDGVNEGSSAFQDTDALADTSVDAIEKTDKVFVKVNNNTPAIDAEADLASFDSDGFTLNWTTNDSVATQILYLALAPKPQATTLVFSTQPGDATAGSTIPGPPTVTVKDDFGNTVTSSTAPITIAIGNNPGGGTLGGTLTKNAVSGVVSFTDLTIGAAGSGYTLTASSTGLTGATSSLFNIAPPPPTPDLLVSSVTDPPGTATVGTGFSVTDTTLNNGTASAAASTTRYRLSLDATITSTDLLLTGSRSVPSLAVGANSTGTVTVTIPTSVAAGTYYLGACADISGVVTEIDENNNCLASVSTIVVTKPDLLVMSVTDPPNTAASGSSFSVTDTTENQGTASAAASTTRYRLSLDTTITSTDTLLTGTRSVPSLAAGATSSGTVTVTIPASLIAETYYLGACADNTSVVAEMDETNNCLASTTTVQVINPDLTVTSVSEPPATANVGTSFSVTDTTTNAGTVSAAASTTRYRLSLDTIIDSLDLLLTGTRSVPSLAAGASSSGTVTVTIPTSVAAGNYFLGACADNTSVVAESNESNNCLASTTTIVVTKPDLIVTALSDPPAGAVPGDSFSITETTTNNGSGPAAASTTRYRLSLDTTINSSDTLLTGTRSVPSLAAGASSTGTLTVTIPSNIALGTYYLGGCADNTSVVAEIDETNNCRASTTTILVSKPDLIVSALGNPLANAVVGGSFSITETTTNSGPVSAAASTTRYRLSLDTTIASTDPLLTGTRSVPSLAAGAGSSATVGVLVPTDIALGTYFLGACADDTALVAEIDETNNCRASATTVVVSPPPSISSLSPTSGSVGTAVTISGANFGASQGASTVTFNGVAATPTSWNSTSIEAPVPAGATTGPVQVTVGRVTSNGLDFTVTSAPVGPGYVYDELGRLKAVIDPGGDRGVYNYDAVGNLLSISRQSSSSISLIEFTPDSGPVGTTVRIYGTGFSTTPSQNTVKFNGLIAGVILATATEIIATVPSGATTGPISVTVGTNTATSSDIFTVTATDSFAAPTITNFSPAVGMPGTSVTITGTNFGITPAQNNVVFNNLTRSTVSSSTATTIVATVPSQTGSGRISVTTPSGKATSLADFFIPPSPFTAADVEFTGRIAIGGSSQTVSIGTANKVGLIVFDGNAAQQASLHVSNVTFGWSSVTIYKPDGRTLMPSVRACSCGAGIVLPPLPVTGTYTILLNPDDPNVGNATLALSQGAINAIAIGGPSVTANITTVGQTAQLTFSGTAGQRVNLGVFNFTVDQTTVTIRKPDGTTLVSKTLNRTGLPGFSFGPDALDAQLPMAGTYTVLVAATSTGIVTLLLSEELDAGAIVIDGSTVSLTISRPGQRARLTFSGTAGQKINLGMHAFTIPKGDVTIFRPNGATLATKFLCDCFLNGPEAIDVQLPDTGTYTILVNPQATNTGNMSLTLSEELDAGAIVIDGPTVATSITRPGQRARLTFGGTVGQKINLGIHSFSISKSDVTIFRPNGALLATEFLCDCFLNGPQAIDVQLPDNGTYTVLIDPENTNTGNMSLTLSEEMDAGAITVGGSSVSVTISRPGQTARLTFTGTAGQQVSLGMTGVTIGADFCCGLDVYIQKPDGTTLTSALIGTNGQAIHTTLTVDGTYTILLNPRHTYTGNVTLTLSQDLDAGAITINGSSVPVTITRPGQRARLILSGTINQQVTVRVTSNTMGRVGVRLLKPDNTSLASNTLSASSFNVGPATLPATDVYTILIDPTNTGTGGTGVNTGSMNVSVTSP